MVNIFKYKHEYVLVEVIEEKLIVISPKLTMDEAYYQRSLIWALHPERPFFSVLEVADVKYCIECRKTFDNEIVYEVHRLGTHLYDVYCFKCAEENKIDFYDATQMIFY